MTLTSKEQFESFASELRKFRDDYTNLVKSKFNSVVGTLIKEFLEKHEDVKAVSWAQYTPYFNDGDSCTFNNSEPELLYLDEEDYYDSYCLGEKVELKHLRDDFKELCSLLRRVDRDAYETAFGDHCRVSMFRGEDDFSVDDYSDHE